MRRRSSARTRRQDGREWLGLLLLATPLASAVAPLAGWADYRVFGLAAGWRALLATALVLAWAATWVRRPSPELRDRQLGRAAKVLVLAMLQGWVVDRYSNGFYASGVLVEGITILLAVHVAAELLRRADDTHRTAGMSDDLALGAAACLGAFWLAAAAGLHSFAAVALILVIPHLALVVVLRGLGVLRNGSPGGLQAARATGTRSRNDLRAAGLMLLLAAGGVGFSYAPAVLTPPAAGEQVTALELVLNVPAMRLDAFRSGVPVRSFSVAVGSSRYPTPIGDHEITRIVWNPWWHPPDSPWARGERVTPPGPGNPMGRVKLLMRGSYYLHGTPMENSIGRACSHGCVRMRDADAIALARLVQLETGARISTEAVDSLVTGSRATREIVLPRPVPIRLVYELAELRGDSVLVHPDIYGRGTGTIRSRMLGALVRGGIDTSRLHRPVLDSVARQARASHVIVPLSALMRTTSRDQTAIRRDK